MSGSEPPSLELSSSGQLSGTPSTAGTYAFTVTVADSSVPPRTASAAVNLKVNDSSIVVTSVSPPAGTVSYPYPGFGFSANGGSPPYTWKTSGTLPPGLTFGNDGTVSGTPTQAGSFPFSVTATDSAQQPMTSTPLATVIKINDPGPVVVNAMPAPPAGIDGTPYGFSFSATGGFLPLQWSITAGGLPPGLTLGSDGSLSGTPTNTGTFTFTVTATDSAQKPDSGWRQFLINVGLPQPPTINNQEAPTGTVNVAYSPYTFSASNGLAPLAWSETPPLTMGLSLSAQGELSGTPTTAGQFPITLNLIDAASRSAPPFPTIVRVSLARPPASFTRTAGSMTMPRSGHSATLLLTGEVLLAGGGNGGPDATAELYDPATETFTPTTGTMTEARSGHTATLLKLSSSSKANYGKVLIVGSIDETAELYDPATRTFAASGSMHHARTSPTATLLNTDKVLIVGGNTTSGDLTAELYDPTSGTFSDTGSTRILRTGHTATLLSDGRVLITGGTGTASAELYDPAHGTFTLTTGNMTEPRAGHTATLLLAADGAQNGYVLIVGTDGSADLYNPSALTFEHVGSLPQGQQYSGHTATPRSDGTVLAAGARQSGGLHLYSIKGLISAGGAYLFAPESDGFTATGYLNDPRDSQTATVLEDGTILIAGGVQRSYRCSPVYGWHCWELDAFLSSAELFK